MNRPKNLERLEKCLVASLQYVDVGILQVRVAVEMSLSILVAQVHCPLDHQIIKQPNICGPRNDEYSQ